MITEKSYRTPLPVFDKGVLTIFGRSKCRPGCRRGWKTNLQRYCNWEMVFQCSMENGRGQVSIVDDLVAEN